MEASVAGAPPAVAEQPAQTQTVEPVAAPVQPTPTEPVAPQQGQTEEGDLRGSFAEMKQAFDQFMESQKPTEDTSLATDLLSALEGPEPEEPQVPAAGTEQGAEQAQLQNSEAQQQLSELQAFIGNQVQELVTPLQRELAARDMEALGQKYEDITSPEVLPQLTTQLNELVALTGKPDLIFNKQIVERTYKMVKAELADASAVPAEQAATQGASLETRASQSQMGDSSLSDQYKSEVFQPRKVSAFG